MSQMFCFQCQQTAGGSGCVKVGVCGKQPDTAALQDGLVCSLVRLAAAARKAGVFSDETTRLLEDGLFMTLTNVNFDNGALRDYTLRLDAAIQALGAEERPVVKLWQGETDTVSLRSTLLFGLKGMAAYAHQAAVLGFREKELIALLIMLGSPTTPSSYVMAKNMGHEGVLTASAIAATTLLSALTLTGWIFILHSGGWL